MNTILLYIVQSSISLIIFYIFYELLFKREAYLGFNRYYLLLAIFISSSLPLIDFNFYQIFSNGSEGAILAAPVYSIVEYSLAEVTIYSNGIQSTDSAFYGNGLSLIQLIILIYFAGVIIKASNFGWKLFQLMRIFRKSKVHELNGLNFIFTEPGTPVFSFFKYVFINKEMFNNYNEIEKVIEHEKIHVRQKHSIDLIIAEILTIIQWFNPLAYMLKKTLKENHEFIADNDVLSTYPDALAYRKLLIENSSIIKTNILTHNFSYSLLKRRLFMIKKTKNPQMFSLKLVWVVLALNMVFFACSGPLQKDEVQTTGQSEKTNEVNADDSDVLMVVEQMPEFDGGMDALIKYLSENIKYPEEAMDKGIQGKVFVGFVVDKDGSIEDVKILREVGGGCDEEAIRVVSNMPNWKPGTQRGEAVKVSYTLPINFVLDANKADSVFTVVEEMPEFPGGRKKLMSYLGNNITYPEAAKNDNISGRVFITFVIEKDGSVNDVKLLRGIGSGCDEEAIRVVSSMPKWKPGLTDGKPVRVQYNLPIKFQLQ